MATIDETNIFSLPLAQPDATDEKLARLGIDKGTYLDRLAQRQKIIEVAEGVKQKTEKKYGLGYPLSQRAIERSDSIKQYTSDLKQAIADPTQEKRDTALESFFETPFPFQMGQYIFDPTGVPTDTLEADYAGRKFKESREARGKGTEFYPGPLGMGDRPFYPDITPEEAGLKLQQGLAIGSIPPGIGGIAGIFQSILGFPARALSTAKTMDGQGGGGGISDIPPQPKRDFAGFVSSVEKVALGPQKFGTGQDLINYLESPRRSGISPKELKYIDFDQIRNNPNLTKEDVVKYIQDNRPQIYRVQRSEDNPTYRADESDNPLTFLPLNEEATRIANAEEQAFFRGEYAQELADHNEILTNNSTLQNSNFVLNSENINDPSVLDDVERYLKSEPEAYISTNPTIVKYTKPDGTTGTGAYETYASIMDFPDKFDELIKLAKDGATIEFPALTRNADDIIEEASTNRVSPDFGNQIEVYEEVGNSGTTYKIIGTEDTGYRVALDGVQVTRRGGSFEPEFYDDLADARARVQDEAFNLGDITEGADTFDTGSNPDQLLETAPFDVITGEATLPTRFGYQYGDFRLPMGGAENYREFTLHIANPKTATRYDSTKGTKHFGGGDELLHYRVTDRIDEDGKKVLFVEEIQSDLHSTASSTKSNATYELSPKEKEKIANQLEEFGLRTNFTGELGGFGNFFYRSDPITGFEKMMDIGALPSIAREIKAGRRANFGSKNADDFVENFGFEKTQEIGALVEKLETGNLPDLPYKKNDYLELAVKDIMKLASEGDYERVAFTNPATQLMRNDRSLEYIDEIEINQVPKLTEAEQQFNENWMRNRDRSMISQMEPNRKLRLDSGLPNSELENFVNTHTDFVVNEPQTQKFWQDFHKNQNIQFNKNLEDYFDEYMVDNLDDLDNAIKNEYGALNDKVDYIFARYDSPPTPSQLAEDLYQSGIIGAKKKKLKNIKDGNDGLIKASVGRPQGALTKDEAYSLQLESDEVISGTVKLPNKPFDEITLDDIFLSDADLDYINQDVRRGISKIMRSFYDQTLPNVEDAGRYIVKQKGTGYKVDDSKFMVERGDITEGYRNIKFDTIDEMIKELRLDENLQKQIRNDVQKGNIPASTIDSQIYKVEAEGGSGKKPLDMYGKIIPQQVDKFVKKYDKSVKPQLKRVLYSNEEGIDANQLYSDFKAEEKLKLEEAQTEGLYGRDFEEPYTHESVSIDITPEMRKAILTEGLNVMYKGGIVRKSQSMDRPIAGNTRYV